MRRDLLDYAVKNLSRKGLRSWLTIIGVVVGISAIVVLVSLGLGVDKEIKSQLTRFGTNYVIVMPGKGFSSFTSGGPPQFAGALYDSDVQAVKIVDGVDEATGIVMLSSAEIVFKGEAVSHAVNGVGWNVYGKWTEQQAGFQSGGPLGEGDVGGVVIGDYIARSLFEKEVRVGNTLFIEGREFKVKGIFTKMGDVGGDFDDGMYVDLKAARVLQGDTFERNRVFTIFALTRADADTAKVAGKINVKLLERHHTTEENKDFQVMTADNIMEQIGGITALLSLFLAGIAAISLVVGGIGIANTMFTSVVERTQEIGILKSIGASTRSILELFLIESALIGFVGGAIGIIFSILFLLVLVQFGVPVEFRVELFAFVLLFAMGVGGVSGYFPARQAARLQPLEALRRD